VSFVSKLADEIRAEIRDDLLPAEDSDLLFLMYALLLLSKGVDVTRVDVHNAWVAWMTHLGKEHESLVPFRELPPATKADDDPFVQAIRRVADRRSK
jgi:hypothetical protein